MPRININQIDNFADNGNIRFSDSRRPKKVKNIQFDGSTKKPFKMQGWGNRLNSKK